MLEAEEGVLNGSEGDVLRRRFLFLIMGVVGILNSCCISEERVEDRVLSELARETSEVRGSDTSFDSW